MSKKYERKQSYKSSIRRVIKLGIVMLVLLFAAIFFVRHIYYQDLGAVSESDHVSLVTILPNTSTNHIADILKHDELIRNASIFEWYVRGDSIRGTELQAGTYALKPNMSVPEIVDIISKGKVATNLVTILPAQRLDQIRSALIKSGFTAADVDDALKPSNYPNAVALSDIPTGATLEGFLYPDSFQKDANTSPKTIIAESLQEMGDHLTPDIRSSFAKEGLSVYQGITRASIVEQEVSSQPDRAQAAQVFLSRISNGMQLGSDVTAYYGALLAGVSPSTTYDSLYNTLLHSGLPPGPISNVSDSSLQAVAHPANTTWLYFVTGDNGITYFSNTAQEHDAQTAQYCHKLCSSTN